MTLTTSPDVGYANGPRSEADNDRTAHGRSSLGSGLRPTGTDRAVVGEAADSTDGPI
jgi:hypothetical protein